jgi:hypothetical protein
MELLVTDGLRRLAKNLQVTLPENRPRLIPFLNSKNKQLRWPQKRPRTMRKIATENVSM